MISKSRGPEGGFSIRVAWDKWKRTPAVMGSSPKRLPQIGAQQHDFLGLVHTHHNPQLKYASLVQLVAC